MVMNNKTRERVIKIAESRRCKTYIYPNTPCKICGGVRFKISDNTCHDCFVHRKTKEGPIKQLSIERWA